MLCSILGRLFPLYYSISIGSMNAILLVGIVSSLMLLWLKKYYGVLIAAGICLFVFGSLQEEPIPRAIQHSAIVLRLGENSLKGQKRLSSTAEWYEIQGEALVPTGILVNCVLHTNEPIANGTLIFTTTIPKRIEENTNPGAFDAQAFYKNKGLYYSAYLGDDFLWIGQQKNGFHYLSDLRENLSQALAKHLKGEAIPLAKALLLGDASTVPPSIKKDFSITGAIHVLAVSGMHIALFAQLLLFSLKPFSPWLSKRKALVLCFLFLWFYAFLTGLSPSVLRSVLMFTIVQAGVFIGRKAPDNHTLLFCGWIMIILDGNCLFDLGFQLSFLAVFGIINYQKTITSMVKTKHRLLSFFWEATAVAIAAQLFTLPIILYNFHTFPNYFLLANLLVVVLSAIAMYLGFAYLFLTFIPIIGSWIGWLFQWVLLGLSKGLHFIAQLPGSVQTGFHISTPMLLFIFLTIFLVLHGKRLKGFRFIPLTLVCVILIFRRMSHINEQHCMLLKSDVPITVVKQKTNAVLVIPRVGEVDKLGDKVKRLVDDYQKIYPLDRITQVSIAEGESLSVDGYAFRREQKELFIHTPTEKFRLRFRTSKPWEIQNEKSGQMIAFKGGITL